MQDGQVKVAVKVLNESFETERYLLRREMEILGQVRSPYVTHFIGAIFHPEMMMVMELLEGGSLYESLAQNFHLAAKASIFSWYRR